MNALKAGGKLFLITILKTVSKPANIKFLLIFLLLKVVFVLS
jgi:hypothetical protein